MSDNLLEIEKLNVDYLVDKGEFRAVKEVSFNIGRGEIFGLAR
ncbi:ABC-type glutathione transport system ATPase component [Rhizobium leguminosarum]